MDRNSQFKIWHSAFILLYLMSVGVVGYTIWTEYRQERANAQKLIINEVQSHSDLSKRLFLDKAYKTWSFLQLVKESTEVECYARTQSKRCKQYLIDLLHQAIVRLDHYENIRFISAEGEVQLRVTRFSACACPPHTIGYTAHSIEALVKEKHIKKPILTSIINKQAPSQGILVFLQPIIIEGEIKGYLSVDLNLKKVFNQIAILVSKNMSLALLDNNGRVLYQNALTDLDIYTDDLSQTAPSMWSHAQQKVRGAGLYGKHYYSYRRLPLLLNDEDAFLYLVFSADPFTLPPSLQQPLDEIEIKALVLFLGITLFFILLPLLYSHITKNRRLLDAELKKIVLESVAPVVILDKELCFFDINQAFERHFNCNLDMIKGKNIAEVPFLSHTSFIEDFTQIRQILWDKKDWKEEVRTLSLDGTQRTEILFISQVRSSSGRITHYVMMFTDISKQKKQEMQLKHLSEYDTLTNCLNRNVFEGDLKQVLMQKRKTPACLAVIDIDRFKTINDTYGHLVGDLVLSILSKLINGSTRSDDVLYRIGGDEFAMLLHATNLPQAEVELQRVCDIVYCFDSSHKLFDNSTLPHDLHLSVSIGLSVIDKNDSPQECFKRADDALYNAKNAGRNCLKVYAS